MSAGARFQGMPEEPATQGPVPGRGGKTERRREGRQSEGAATGERGGKEMRDERKKREDGRRRKGNRRKKGDGWSERGNLGALLEKAEMRRKKAWEMRNVSRSSEGRRGENQTERKQRGRGEAQNVAEKGEGVGGCGNIPFFQSAEAFAAQSRGGEKLTLVFSPSAGIVSLQHRGKRRIRGNTMRHRHGSAGRDGVTSKSAFGLLIGFRLR